MKATHQLIKIHKKDAHFKSRKRLEGRKGFFDQSATWENGSGAGEFRFYRSDIENPRYFYSATIKELLS